MEEDEEGETSPRAPDEYGGDIDGNRKQGHRSPSRGGGDRLVGPQPLLKTDVDQSQLALRSARSTPRFMIDPRYSKFSQYWDLVTMFALLFTAIVTPYEVSFLEAPSSWDEVDVLFIVRPSACPPNPPLPAPAPAPAPPPPHGSGSPAVH